MLYDLRQGSVEDIQHVESWRCTKCITVLAPLKAIMFLEQAPENRIIPLDNGKEITRRQLAGLIKPFETVN